MMTPLLLWLHDYLQRRGYISLGRAARNLERSDSSVRPTVLVCGFGRVGQTVCQMLDAQNIPYLAIDLDIDAVMMGREMGFNVVYGNTTNRDVLVDLGLRPRGIKSVVVALDNASTARQTIMTIKTIAPRIKIFARARNLADAKMLMSQGVASAMPETIESSLFLGYSVLDFLGVPERKIEKLLSEIRSDDYACLSAIISDKHE